MMLVDANAPLEKENSRSCMNYIAVINQDLNAVIAKLKSSLGRAYCLTG